MQKAYLITRAGPSLHSDPTRAMPVSTRTTSADAGSHCPAQPATSMEAGGQDPDPKENQPNKNNTTPQPYTPVWKVGEATGVKRV